MSLTEFLLARIAEDEALANAWTTARDARYLEVPPPTDALIAAREVLADRFARVLAECEAKRRIVERYDRACDGFKRTPNPGNAAGMYVMTEVLQMLALPYADHPDYREEWKRR